MGRCILFAITNVTDYKGQINAFHQEDFGAARAGVKIPEELSVVSFDNLPESAEMFPALTTYDQKLELAAELLVNSLLERIANPGLPLRRHSYTVELKERESVKLVKKEVQQ